MSEPKAECPNFKPSPLAAWMCAWWIFYGPVFEDTENKISPWCLEGELCPTAGLRTKPRSNYQPGDDGEVT